MGATADGIEAAALRLRQADTLRRQCRPLDDLLADATEADAYAVQEMVVELQRVGGAEVSGYKLLTVADQDEPVHGLIVDTLRVANGGALEPRRLLEPVVELKLALAFGADLAPASDVVALRAALVGVAAVIEVADRRIGGALGRRDIIADNALAGPVVVGPMVAPAQVGGPLRLQLHRGATRVLDEAVPSLAGALAAVAWLAAAVRRRGRPVRAGDLVVTPPLGASVPVRAGETYRASGDPLAPVSVTIADPARQRLEGDSA